MTTDEMYRVTCSNLSYTYVYLRKNHLNQPVWRLWLPDVGTKMSLEQAENLILELTKRNPKRTYTIAPV